MAVVVMPGHSCAGELALPTDTKALYIRYANHARILVYSAGAFTTGLSLVTNDNFARGVALALLGSLYAVLTAYEPRVESVGSRHQSAIAVGDTVLISCLVWYTGGAYSEYFILYLIPIVIAAIRRDSHAGMVTCLSTAILYAFVALLAPQQEPALSLPTVRVATVFSGVLVIILLFHFLQQESKLSDDLRDTLHHSLRRVAAVYEVAHAANAGVDLTTVLTIILDHAARASGAVSGIVSLVSEDGRLQPIASLPSGGAEGSFTLDANLAEEALRQSQMLTGQTSGESPAGVAYVPLIAPSHPLGVLTLIARPAKHFTQRQLDLLNSLCEEAALAIENAQLRAELRQLAVTDSLTSLVNRREIERRLSQELLRAERYHRSLSLMMVDVDNLKAVNDRYGHGAGDEVLVVLSQLMQQSLRESDTAGRIGGDEFAILLPETELEQAALVAERLVAGFSNALTSHPELPEAEHIAALVGISIGLSDNATGRMTADELVTRADAAMYEAKRRGKNHVRVSETTLAPTTL